MINEQEKNAIAAQMYNWVKDLFPVCRSLTGPGVRETLSYIQRVVPELEVKSVPSGSQAFDWTVPPEWHIRNAWVEHESGERVIDFADHNLHVLGYSIAFDGTVSLEELQEHLYSIPEQPNAIPYVTSYYKERWGFCLTHEARQRLKPGHYHVHVDSDLTSGVLNYGELVLPGETEDEILLTTYVCHPSMANNELSGPAVLMALIQALKDMPSRKYTYRMLFLPETIGSIVYLSQHLEHLQQHVKAGFVVTCVGDDLAYSYLPSRKGGTLSDRAAQHVLRFIGREVTRYTWLDRGSDERQFCAPGVDLPMCAMMRSKYGEYPEYHTSLDNLEFVSEAGLYGGYIALRRAIEAIEYNHYPKVTVLCEPQLGKRGLYPTISSKGHADHVRAMMNFISYCDGEMDLIEIAERINEPIWEIIPIMKTLNREGLITY